MKQFENLPPDWNGYSADPVPKNVVERSVKILSTLQSIPYVFPTGRQSIQFEFSNNGYFCEAEIFEDKITLVCLKGANLEYVKRSFFRSINPGNNRFLWTCIILLLKNHYSEGS